MLRKAGKDENDVHHFEEKIKEKLNKRQEAKSDIENEDCVEKINIYEVRPHLIYWLIEWFYYVKCIVHNHLCNWSVKLSKPWLCTLQEFFAGISNAGTLSTLFRLTWYYVVLQEPGLLALAITRFEYGITFKNVS